MSSETQTRSDEERSDLNVEKGNNDTVVEATVQTAELTGAGNVEQTTTSTGPEAPKNAPEDERSGGEAHQEAQDEDEDGFPVPEDKARGRMVSQVAGPPKSSGRPR